MTRRAVIVVYGVVAYGVFLCTLVYTIGFLAGVGVPKGVDDGVVVPAWRAVLVNGALLMLFAVQHSVMARPWFKRRWTRLVAPAVERSTYVLVASLVVALLMWQWHPLPDPVWSVRVAWAQVILWTGYALGWGLVVSSTFLLDHFDLFGLRQVLDRARERRYAEPEVREPTLCRYVRHPLMVGFLIAFWVVPDMSVGRLLFAVTATGYIMIGVRLEEHDLRAQLGEPYRRYLERVPRFVPRPSTLMARRRAGSTEEA